jgi:hypothetical protein
MPDPRISWLACKGTYDPHRAALAKLKIAPDSATGITAMYEVDKAGANEVAQDRGFISAIVLKTGRPRDGVAKIMTECRLQANKRAKVDSVAKAIDSFIGGVNGDKRAESLIACAQAYETAQAEIQRINAEYNALIAPHMDTLAPLDKKLGLPEGASAGAIRTVNGLLDPNSLCNVGPHNGATFLLSYFDAGGAIQIVTSLTALFSALAQKHDLKIDHGEGKLAGAKASVYENTIAISGKAYAGTKFLQKGFLIESSAYLGSSIQDAGKAGGPVTLAIGAPDKTPDLDTTTDTKFAPLVQVLAGESIGFYAFDGITKKTCGDQNLVAAMLKATR